MKRTQRRDAQQNIRKQWISFLSIVIIAAMAVSAYLGLNYAARSIAKSGNRFYDDVRFRDAEVVSTLLLSAEDLDSLRATEGVADVEPVWQTSGTLSKGETGKSAAVVSLTERINVPLLLSGRLPEAEDECVVDLEIATALDLAEGDAVRISGAPYLLREQFTVCGIVLNADHANTEISTPGDRNVVVLPAVFDREALDGCAMKALLRYADCEGVNRFDAAYFTAAADTTARIKALAGPLSDRRTESIHTQYEQQLAEGEQQLSDAEAQLSDARQQLDDGWEELADGEAQAADAWEQLSDAERQLADAREQLSDGEQQLADGRVQLWNAWQELSDALRQLTDGQLQLDDALAVLSDARQQLDDGWAEYRDNEALLADAKALLDDGKLQLDDGRVQLDDAWAQLEAALAALNDGEAQYLEGKEQLRQGEADLYAGSAALADGRNQLIEGYDQLEDGKNQIRTGMREAIYTISPDTCSRINWYTGGDVNVDNPSANATDFPITDEVSIDLSLSMRENVANFLSDLANSGTVTLDELRDYVEAAYGPLPEGDPYDAIAGLVVDHSGAVGDSYEELAGSARAWNEGHDLYIAGANQLDAGSRQFMDGRMTLLEAREALDAGWEQYREGLAQYEEGAALLEEKAAEYAEGLAQYEEGVALLAEGLKKLEDGEAEYADGQAQYDEAKARLDEGWEQYNDGLAQYQAAQAEFFTKSGEYDDGLEQYNDGLAQYETGSQEYADAMQALADGRKELDDGEAQYAQGMADYLEGVLKLSDARAQLAGLDRCRWVILDPNGNAAYQVLKADIQNVSDLAMAFALIFILVGALVIYATLGKIVEEQRRLVGATRALGFYKNEILAKYLVFGVGATLLGMLLGVAIGYFLIQPMLTGGYGQFFNFDSSVRALSPIATTVVLLGGLLLAALAVSLACTDLLRSTATSLMQEKAPSTKQRGGRSNKAGGSLYARLILLNMRTDLKRVIVTIVSIAGCCALLVTGFTMRNGVMQSLERRFEDILHFDYAVYLSEDSGEAAFAAAQSELERAGAQSVAVRTVNQLYSIDGELNANTLYCGDFAALQPFADFADVTTGAPLTAEPEGLWICRKVSEVSHLTAGDSITLYDSAMRPYEIPIAGVFEDYLIRDMAMSRESYAHFFGAAPKDNALLVNKGSMDIEALERLLASLPGVERVSSNAQDRADMYSIAAILNLVALLMVGLAAIMAFFIILNLINMQIHQKKRELTIMRINGFTVREVIVYILQEAIVTNVVGILLGLGLGMLLSYRIICLIEGVTARFVRTPQPMSLILSALITAAFSVILHIIALRKVKHLKLTDIA